MDFRFLAEHSADIICRFGLDNKLHYVSPASLTLLGWTPEEMQAMPPFGTVVPEDIPIILSAIERNNQPGMQPVPITVRNRHKDGNTVWLEVSGTVVRDSATQAVVETVLVMRDVTERKRLEDQLMAQARTDALTGLRNRRAFDEALEWEWARTLRESSQVSLLLLDLDHFKQFNDRYGHQVGDDCLRAVAMAVENAVRRQTDIAARYGGEEFVVILPATDSSGALAVAEKVRQAVAMIGIPHDANKDAGGIVTVSIGVATALARHGGTMKMPESLLLSADHALYKAKHTGRNRVASTMLMASPTS